MECSEPISRVFLIVAKNNLETEHFHDWEAEFLKRAHQVVAHKNFIELKIRKSPSKTVLYRPKHKVLSLQLRLMR